MNDVRNEEAAARLTRHLDDAEDQLRSSIEGQERFALLSLIRAADHTGYSRSLGGPPPKIQLADYLQASWLGIAPALALCGKKAFSGQGVAWAPSTQNNEAWANSLLNRMGLAANTRRLCGLSRHGLAEVRWLAADRVEIAIVAEDLEAIDRETIHWYSKTLNAENRPLLQTLDELLGDWARRQLQGRVASDPTFGIRYTSCAELEDFFEAQAELRAATLPGHDSLPDDAVLGPVTFGDIRRAVVMGMGRALKHVAFAETLMRRDSATSFRTILTTFATASDLADQWRSRLGLSRSQMEAVMQILALTGDDLPHIAKAFDAPQAMLVFAADGFWHQPIFGALNNPFGWVTRKLRRTYAADWDRAVDRREAAFREDLRAQFPEPRFHLCPKSAKLRGPAGVKTDVDAVIIDRTTGVMAVFQLKWQEPFEFSLAERESRRRNLIKEGNRWTEVIEGHCGGLDAASSALALGVAAGEATRVTAMRIFILTRNGARFSGPVEQSSRAVWVSWFELLRAVSEDTGDDPFTHLWHQTPSLSADRNGRFAYRLDGILIEGGR